MARTSEPEPARIAMNGRELDHRGLLRRLAWTGAALAFGLIVLGGVVRITGSGMGCGRVQVEKWG